MFPLLVWIECHDCVLKWRTGLNINGFAWNNMKWIWFSQKMKKSRIYAIRCPQHWAYPWMTIRTHRDGLSLSIPQIPEQCHPFESDDKTKQGRKDFVLDHWRKSAKTTEEQSFCGCFFLLPRPSILIMIVPYNPLDTQWWCKRFCLIIPLIFKHHHLMVP